MAGKNFSSHQQKIIKNYYENLDTIMLQKLQELVTDLYLETSDLKYQKLWDKVEKCLDKLGIPESIKQHIMQKKDANLLARHINDWLK